MEGQIIAQIGEIRLNNHGTKMKIVKLNSTEDLDIEFLDDYHYIKTHVTYSNFKRGQVKNPYDKTIYGIGMIGNGKFKTGRADAINKEYETWFHMLRRCYSKKDSNMYPAYFGKCEVCDEWLNYQNFAEWYTSNYYRVNERLHIDKDILDPKSKIYSPNTCILVPQRINELFTYKKNNLGLPVGIRKTSGGKYRAGYNTQTLGTFNTLEEAFAAYRSAKENAIIKIADEYKNIIPSRLYEAMINYKVLMSNDENCVA